ncbi:hypothetical protein ACYPTH_27760, partial [Klebsiella pneumoniae]
WCRSWQVSSWFQHEVILPGHTQQHDLLRLWQFWHNQEVKTRLARERSQEKHTHRLFFYC